MDTQNKKFKLDFMPIGQDIKQAREARDMTREQLSEIIDYVPRHIQALENEGQTPSVDYYSQPRVDSKKSRPEDLKINIFYPISELTFSCVQF